jgi:hypothetical protein
MKSKIYISCIVFICAFYSISAQEAQPKVSFTIGSALGFQYYNCLQQNSTNGTPVQLSKYSNSNTMAYRLQFNYYFKANQYLRILLSPFNETGLLTPNNELNIQNKIFAKGEPINTSFGFNVLRIGFAFEETAGKFRNYKYGGTLAIRKWQASFVSNKQDSKNDNLIAVPLLFVGHEKTFFNKIKIDTEVDGLLVPFAYVLEGGTSAYYLITKNISAGLQYRILSGYYEDSEIKNNFTTQNLGINIKIAF